MQDEQIDSTIEERSSARPRTGKDARIRLLIADDHAKYRAELRRLLQDEPDIAVNGEAQDEVETVRMAHKLKPDVILMDLEMAEDSSIQAVRDICVRQPNTRIILMVQHNDEQLVMDGLRAGAWAHISKFSPPAEFAWMVRRVYSGLVCVDSQIMGRILQELQYT